MDPVAVRFAVASNATASLLLCLPALIGTAHRVPGGRYLYVSLDQSTRRAGNGAVFRALLASGDFTFITADRCIRTSVLLPSRYILSTYGSDLRRILQNVDGHLDHISCEEERWRPDTQLFVILYTDMSALEYSTVASRIIEKLWDKMVYNCAVLLMPRAGTGGTLFVADPFAEDNACGRRLRSWSPPMNCPKDHPVNYLFTNRIKPYPGCGLFVLVRDTPPFSFRDGDNWKGTEVELAKTMADCLGLRITWKYQSPLDMKDFAVKMSNRTDLAIGARSVNFVDYYRVKYLRTHTTQYLTFFVADGRPVTMWEVQYSMFPPEVWCMVALSLAAAAGVMRLYRARLPGPPSMKVLAIVLQCPVRLPRSGRLRLFFISLIVPFYWLSSIYTTRLHSLTIRPPTEQGPTTPEDIFDRVMEVLATESAVLLLKQHGFHRRMMLRPVLDTGAAAGLLEQRRDFAIVERDKSMDYVIALNGYSLHKLPNPIYLINQALVVPKGSPFKERFDAFSRVSLESGLYQKWTSDVLGEARIRPDRARADAAPEPRPLALADLKPAFEVLFYGLGLSMIVFILEVALRGRLAARAGRSLSHRCPITNTH